MENGDTIRNADVNTAGRNGSGTIYHEDGSDTYINRTRSGTTVQHTDGATHNRVSVGDDGKISATGNINREVDPTKDGATVTHVGYDTDHGSYNTTITDNQTGTKYYGATDDRDGQTVGVETRSGVKVEADRSSSGSLNAKLRADKVKLGEDTAMNNTNVNVAAGTASTSISHGDGSDTYVNRTRSGTTIQHTNGATHNSVSVGDDGSIEIKGNINREVDPDKDGVTVTHVGYNTGKGEAEATITNNRTGRKVYVEKEKDGFTIGTEKGPDSRTSVSIDKSGEINIKGKGGRSVNVTKAIRFIKGLTR